MHLDQNLRKSLKTFWIVDFALYLPIKILFFYSDLYKLVLLSCVIL